MHKAVSRALYGIFILYLVSTIFGALLVIETESDVDLIISTQNVFLANFSSNVALTLTKICVLVNLSFATPVNLIPLKDVIETMAFKDEMSQTWNYIITIGLSLLCLLVAIVLPSLGLVI